MRLRQNEKATPAPVHELLCQQMSQYGVFLLSQTNISTVAEEGAGSKSAASNAAPPAFSLRNQALDAALPHRGLPYGMVTELRAQNASGVGTSFALRACHAIQRAGAAAASTAFPSTAGSSSTDASSTTSSAGIPWCAYLDPNETLFAPGVAQQGVNLQHLLVLHPPEEEALARSAVHIAQSGLLSLIVLDLRTSLNVPSQQPGQRQTFSRPYKKSFNCRLWNQTVRRLSLAIEGTNTCVLLLTQADTVQSQPLPVGLRLEVAMQTPEHLVLRVTKERTGRVSAATVIPWSASPSTCGENPT